MINIKKKKSYRLNTCLKRLLFIPYCLHSHSALAIFTMFQKFSEDKKETVVLAALEKWDGRFDSDGRRRRNSTQKMGNLSILSEQDVQQVVH